MITFDLKNKTIVKVRLSVAVPRRMKKSRKTFVEIYFITKYKVLYLVFYLFCQLLSIDTKSNTDIFNTIDSSSIFRDIDLHIKIAYEKI